MTTDRIERIRTLLEGIETGDPEAVSVISPTEYIQHNPQTQTGREGLAALFERLSRTSPRVNVVRAFADGDFVFGHTEYDFDTRRIGFEVFRFEGDLTVEHWDNIQPRLGPNASGHTMVDGPTSASDLHATESNRTLVRGFVEQVCIAGEVDALRDYVSRDGFTEHSPDGADGFEAFERHLERTLGDQGALVDRRLHRVLAQGDFVLAVCEGTSADVHVSFYDLYRVERGHIVEHWGTIEAIAPPEQWKHDNGKF